MVATATVSRASGVGRSTVSRVSMVATATVSRASGVGRSTASMASTDTMGRTATVSTSPGARGGRGHGTLVPILAGRDSPTAPISRVLSMDLPGIPMERGSGAMVQCRHGIRVRGGTARLTGVRPGTAIPAAISGRATMGGPSASGTAGPATTAGVLSTERRMGRCLGLEPTAPMESMHIYLGRNSR